MRPPDERTRPLDKGGSGEDSGSKSLASNVTRIADSPPQRAHRVRDLGRYGRRRAARQLDVLLEDLFPPVPAVPSSYSLEAEALRAHARDLWRAGWQMWELAATLDVDLAGGP